MTSTVTRSQPALVAVIAGLLVAVLLGGCASRDPGAAAVVGDRRITVSEVQNAFTDITALIGPDQQITQADILYLLIMEPSFTSAAAAAGVGVSDLDAEQQFGAVTSNGSPRFSNSSTLQVLRSSFAQQKLLSTKSKVVQIAYLKALNAQVKSEGLRINPRYGSGLNSTTTLGIDQVQPDWLATPKAAAPSASTAP